MSESNVTAPLREAPQAPSFPVLGNLPDMLKGAHGDLYDAYREIARKHGDYVRVDVPGFPGYKFLVVSDVKSLQIVLQSRMNDFPKGRTLDEARALGLGGNGITEVEGSDWSGQRRMLMAFYQPKRINELFPKINRSAEKAVELLSTQTDVEIFAFMNRIVLHLAYGTLFGLESKLLDDIKYEDPVQYRQTWVVNQMMRRMAIGPWYRKLPLPANYKLKRMVAEQKAFFDKALKHHEDNPGKLDTLLANYIATLDEKGKKLSRDDLHDQIQTFLGGGLESVGAVLHWLIHYLSENPRWEEKIYAEIMSTAPEGDILPEHLKSMETLVNAVAETIRLRPPFPFLVREAIKEDSLGGYRVHKGDLVIMPLQWINTRPDVWGPDAEKFDPSRFNHGNAPEHLKDHYVPFGYGPRVCLGRRLADAEAAVIAAHLIRNFKFRLKPNQEVVPYLRFSWYAKSGIHMFVEKRVKDPLTKRTHSAS